MTQIEKSEVEKRLENLKQQQQKLINNLNQLAGAIAFAEGLLIKEVKPEEVKPEEVK